MMIARGENVLTRDVDQARELGERRALVIVRVTKTKIDRVALIIKFRVLAARAFDELDDTIHFSLIFRSQTFQALGVVKQLGLRVLVYEIDYFGQDRLCA